MSFFTPDVIAREQLPAPTAAAAPPTPPTFTIGGLGRGVFPRELPIWPFDAATTRLLIQYVKLKLHL